MKLTPTQREIYDLIMQNNGIGYKDLCQELWGEFSLRRYGTLKVVMCHLKKRLAEINLYFPADHSHRPVMFYPVEVIPQPFVPLTMQRFRKIQKMMEDQSD